MLRGFCSCEHSPSAIIIHPSIAQNSCGDAMISLWTAQTELPRFTSLEGDINTEVLIIGGGLAGLLCARELTDRGVSCVVLEAETICGGVTRNTTAKITSQHGLIYDKLLSHFGAQGARLYLEANENALEKYRSMCRSIDCGFVSRDAYLYSLSGTAKLRRETAALHRIGYDAELTDRTSLPFKVSAALRFKHQAQFNPLQFAAAIAEGLTIYENSQVLSLNEHEAVTDAGSVTANKIIVTTHFPFLNKHGSYFMKLYQDRSYVIALKNAEDVRGMYLSIDRGVLSFRNYGDYLLLGDGGHRTGKKGGGWRALEDFAKKYYPRSEIVHRWAAQDCMTLDGAPYIGRYSAKTPDLYVATGFNKWGMTSSMVAAELIADIITGVENRYEALFSPSRSMLRPQLAVNGFESVVSLLTPTKPRCPHMGCALKWNDLERTWDCPCHGSRFTEDGRLIDNPATGGLNK